LSFQRTALGMIVNVILNFLLIPGFGVMGAAIATVISQATAAWFFDSVQLETRRMFFMKLKAMNPLRINYIFR